MYPRVWTPHVTVAAVVASSDRFLVVRERADGCYVYNQPAGHLEPDERLVDAVQREVLEEARCQFTPEALVGLYRWVHPGTGETHVRIAFSGRVNATDRAPPADDAVVSALWCSYGDLQARADELRSPMVMRCIDDYLAGHRYPLSLLRETA
jgi:ADP-ribose pyrophosphatase YjhB (NUDIX family)